MTLILTFVALPAWLGTPAAAQPLADYNGDGYADLAIGVPGEQINGQSGAGMVNVIYGSASGLSATAVPDQRFFQDFSLPGDPASNISDASEADDSFGGALASGDFNNDGHTDLAVGVPDEDVGPDVDAGAVNVIYGSPSGLSSTVLDDQFWHQDSANVEGFTDTSEHFGSALATGDFNGDGYDDLAVGTPLDYVDSIGGAGSANIIYGSPSGLSAAADQLWHQNVSGIKDSVDFGDHFASSLAAGDFDNDGIDDLAAGVPDEDVNGQANAGLVNIIYGSISGLTSASDQRFFQDYSVPGDPASNIADSSEPNDRFGASVAAGDFD
ncbi:MAG: FG-GAP repeat protein, partial [Nitrososphaera sp.]